MFFINSAGVMKNNFDKKIYIINSGGVMKKTL